MTGVQTCALPISSKVKELCGEIVSAALADATTATNPRPAAAEHVEALLNKVMGG